MFFNRVSKIDWVLVVSCMVLTIFGLVFIYTLSAHYSDKTFGHPFYYFHQQLAGFLVAVIFSVFLYRKWSLKYAKKYEVLFLTVSLVIIVLTFIPGTRISLNGATRMLDFGFIKFFPFPIALLSLFMFFSSYMSRFYAQDKLISRHCIIIITITFVLTGLLYLQPDASSALILYLCVISQTIVSRLYKVSAVLLSCLAVTAAFFISGHSYISQRLLSFLNPFDDRFSTGYQLSTGLTAIGGGDWIGSGIGHGIINRNKFYGSFESFTFSSITEEAGFIGSLLMSLVLLLIVWRSLNIALQAFNKKHIFETLLVTAITTLIFLVTIFHIASNLGIAPTANFPLPFISFSPSYQFAFVVGMAIILKIGVTSYAHQSTFKSLRLIRFSVVLVFCVIAFNLYTSTLQSNYLNIQYNNRVKYIQQNNNKHTKAAKLEAAYKLGMITDRYEKTLAKYTPVFDVGINPVELTNDSSKFNLLFAHIDVDMNILNKKIIAAKQLDRKFLYLKRNINNNLAESIKKLDIKGVYLIRSYKRTYLGGKAVADLIGVSDIDNNGLSGSELQFNNVLRPNITGNKPNGNIQLSIDLRVQNIAHLVLSNVIETSSTEAGAALVTDTHTGEILALVNASRLSASKRESHASAKKENFVVSHLFEPFESILPFVILASLDGKKNSLLKKKHFLESTLRLRTSDSINTLALETKKNILTGTLKKLGFLSKTNVEMPYEHSGSLTMALDDEEIDAIELSHGKGINITAIQLAQAYSILANDGLKVPLTLLKRDISVRGVRKFSAESTQYIKYLMHENDGDELLGLVALSRNNKTQKLASIYAGISREVSRPVSIVVILDGISDGDSMESSMNVANEIYTQSKEYINATNFNNLLKKTESNLE